jgi:hypothetical protein
MVNTVVFPFILPPMVLSVFGAVHNMCLSEPTMATGGTLWFPDLIVVRLIVVRLIVVRLIVVRLIVVRHGRGGRPGACRLVGVLPPPSQSDSTMVLPILSAVTWLWLMEVGAAGRCVRGNAVGKQSATNLKGFSSSVVIRPSGQASDSRRCVFPHNT